MQTKFRHADGLLPTLAALSYGAGAWVLGLWLCTVPSLWLNGAGVLLLCHALVISAYLLHECAHNSVFAASAHNARLGLALAWQTGACYSAYEALREKHFRHHIDNADVVALDHRRWLQRHPRIRRLVIMLEWAYVPALDLLMHALAVVRPWRRNDAGVRRRIARVLCIRLALFGVLGWYSAKALVLYGVAYLLFLHVMRFFDVHQHTYEVIEIGGTDKPAAPLRGNREYEQQHTFSNLISAHQPWLNLLALNFPYHNAHHARPTEPWYRLPALHRSLFGERSEQVLKFRHLLQSYHRFRVERIMGVEQDMLGDGPARGRDFAGALGVSFLVAH